LHDDRRNGGQEDVFKRSRVLDSQQGCTFCKETSMTPEDEEFNRIEMESRIKQEYIRNMKPHVPFMSISMDDYLRLSDELAIARVLIRELGDRLAKLEGKQ